MIAWLGPNSAKGYKQQRSYKTGGINNDIVVSGVILLVRILYNQVIPLCDDESLFYFF